MMASNQSLNPAPHSERLASLRDRFTRASNAVRLRFRGARQGTTDSQDNNAASNLLTGLWGDACHYMNELAGREARLKIRVRTLEDQLNAARSALVVPVADTPANAASHATMSLGVQTLPPSSPRRPETSDSVQNNRAGATLAVIRTALMGSHVTSGTTDAIHDLPPEWVEWQLRLRRNADVEASTDHFGPVSDGGTGCWMTGAGVETDNVGRPSINWRTTNRPDRPGTRIGFSVKMHLLAVVAGGRGLQLLSLSKQGGDQAPCSVSHLCHNDRCFNPEHVVVEPHRVNLSRSVCAGRMILRARGLTVDPCPHTRDKRCVLATWDGTVQSGSAYYEALPDFQGYQVWQQTHG